MDNVFAIKDTPNCVLKFPDPPRSFTMYGPDGKEATVDFGGDAVVYSGDLPIDESAKIFFDTVFSHWKR